MCVCVCVCACVWMGVRTWCQCVCGKGWVGGEVRCLLCHDTVVCEFMCMYTSVCACLYVSASMNHDEATK